MKPAQFLSMVAVASSVAAIAIQAPAQAISFTVNSGIASPGGVTNQGSYSEFSQDPGFVTVDFNDGTAPTSGFAQYSFVNSGRGGDNSLVTTNMWAPDGTNNEVNNSKYLQVFSGQDVVIQLAETLNYFGINWGSESVGNVFSFFLDDLEVGRFGVDDIDFAQIGSLSSQGTGYVDFRSESTADVFNRIVISQHASGGFETDNHTFQVGTGAFDPNGSTDVPEPGLLLGLLALGGAIAVKRQARVAV